MNFLLGVLFLLAGGCFAYYAKQLEKWFGLVKWAEDNLGGTSKLYAIIGFMLVFLGFMVIWGVIRFV